MLSDAHPITVVDTVALQLTDLYTWKPTTVTVALLSGPRHVSVTE